MTNKVIKIFFFPVFLIIFLFPFIFPTRSFSQEKTSLPSISIINLIRGNELGHENDDLTASLYAQYKVTSDANVNATWLLQYSVLEKESLINFAKNNMPGQEFGLLFEIDRNFTQKSSVQYRGQGPWYFSDGLFLVSYDVSERKKLIDSAFSKFKKTFGYYPKTVGAWWIGADSLLYMQEKYGITSSLRASDQFNLDFYSIWGTPFSIPYLSSKENQAIPAKDYENSLKVVNLQWAARDPVRGYKDPLYSIQDYSSRQYDTGYVDHLLSIYLKSPYDNVVFGLENGGTIKTFNNYYKTMLEVAKKLEKSKKAEILLAKDYANKFLSKHRVFSNNNYFLAKDYESNDQSFWYISESFRVLLQKTGKNIYLSDLRDYSNKKSEDFKLLPNSQPRLFINTPYLTDTMFFPENKILIDLNDDLLQIKESDNKVVLLAGKKTIGEFNKNQIKLFSMNNKTLTYNFNSKNNQINIFYILIATYFIYFAILYFYKKNFKAALKYFWILLIPLFLSLQFLIHQPDYIFDKKELIVLNMIPLSFLNISDSIFFIKLIPFFILFLTHYILIVKNFKTRYKPVFFIIFYVINIIYLHTFYFPLDKSTYKEVAVIFFVLVFVILSFIFIFINKTKQKNSLLRLILVTPLIIILLVLVIITSRSKYAVTEFEISALQAIQNQNKNVLYVTQANQIKPIYKAIKPAISENKYKLAKNLTGKNWQEVIRPKNHVLKLTNYDNKIIVISRYLGGDISDHETKLLNLKKIFDNSQIAIFEKN